MALRPMFNTMLSASPMAHVNESAPIIRPARTVIQSSHGDGLARFHRQIPVFKALTRRLSATGGCLSERARVPLSIPWLTIVRQRSTSK